MPELKNARHERFCQLVVQGKTQEAAYAEAGFEPCRGHASRLASNGSVRERIRELQVKAAEKVGTSLESVLSGLVTEATDKDSPAAARVSAYKALLSFHLEMQKIAAAQDAATEEAGPPAADNDTNTTRVAGLTKFRRAG